MLTKASHVSLILLQVTPKDNVAQFGALFFGTKKKMPPPPTPSLVPPTAPAANVSAAQPPVADNGPATSAAGVLSPPTPKFIKHALCLLIALTTPTFSTCE